MRTLPKSGTRFLVKKTNRNFTKFRHRPGQSLRYICRLSATASRVVSPFSDENVTDPRVST